MGLDGTSSSDPGGAALTYKWDFDYDGHTFTIDATGATTTLATTTSDGGRVITVALRPTNSSGASDVATAGVKVLTPTQAIDALIDDGVALDFNGDLLSEASADALRAIADAIGSAIGCDADEVL